MQQITVSGESPESKDAVALLEELSAFLESLTGDSGKNSFDISDLKNARSVFAVARNQNGEAVGCGAVRPYDEETAELKRVYARAKSSGVGSSVIAFLESQAHALGYMALRLETRLVNQKAVAFYKRHGYICIPNYGKYVGNDSAICFEKRLDGRGSVEKP